jgi:hypothetical protein
MTNGADVREITDTPTAAYDVHVQVWVGITRSDGGTSVMGFITHAEGSGGIYDKPATDENIQAEVDKTFPPDGPVTAVSWTRLAGLNANRTFRNVWKVTGDSVGAPLPVARAVQMFRIRTARNKKLVELDALWLKLFSQGEDVAAVNAAKQTLRDLPALMQPLVNAANTEDGIAAVWQDGLGQYINDSSTYPPP